MLTYSMCTHEQHKPDFLRGEMGADVCYSIVKVQCKCRKHSVGEGEAGSSGGMPTDRHHMGWALAKWHRQSVLVYTGVQRICVMFV